MVGVLGAWGQGKSSFINLMKEQMVEDPALTVVDFNPWMFSGAEQLVDHFFQELAAEFKGLQDTRLSRTADLLVEYGDALGSASAAFGFWGQVLAGGIAAARLGAKRYQSKLGSATQRREQVARELSKLDRPVVVIIDDIDRLTTAEIREIFKLVRLTASFPNLIYVLAFDRDRVEAALDETNVPGRAYLEKIVQLSFDLPAASRETLIGGLLPELQTTLDLISDEVFDEALWPDALMDILVPLIGNMRDVKRLSMSVRPTLLALAHQIEIVDLLCMESLRVFRPNVFAKMRSMRSALTQTSGGFSGSGKVPEHQAQVDELLAMAGTDEPLVRLVIERVFPAAQKYVANNTYGPDWVPHWRRAHRLASADHLAMYLDRIAPTELVALQTAELLVRASSDPQEFDRRLASTSALTLVEVFDALVALKDEFDLAAFAPVLASMMNLVAAVPESRPVGGVPFAIPPHVTVIRVVLKVLERLPDEQEREAVVEAALPLILTWSSRIKLIHSVGYRENAGARIVSEGFAERVEHDLATAVTSEPFDSPAAEWDLARVFQVLREQDQNVARMLHDGDPDLTRALLESVRGANRSQSLGSRHMRETPVLAWDWLIELFGAEESLRDAIQRLRDVDGDSELLALADRYLSGWRPEDEDRWS